MLHICSKHAGQTRHPCCNKRLDAMQSMQACHTECVASAGIHDMGWLYHTKYTYVINICAQQTCYGQNKSAALNVDHILEITGQLGKQSSHACAL